MHKDWRDFKEGCGNIEGARKAFENACLTLFRKEHPNDNVKSVRVKQGDGGIDIFVGEIGIKPIKVYQCKFFLEEKDFGESQKKQIRESFNTCINSPKYELAKWILCVPMELAIDEHSWWAGWKAKTLKTHGKSDEFISLKDGNELIDLMKEHGVYNAVFHIEDSLLAKDTNEKVTELWNYRELDESEDRTIIGEICNHILEQSPIKKSLDSEITASDSFVTIMVKVSKNFPSEQLSRIKQMITNTWEKQQIVKSYLENQEDESIISDLKERIQQDYCRVRNVTNPEESINDAKFIDELSQMILPEQKRGHERYQSNAKAILFNFFEFCYYGEKTEEEKNQQGSLFD